MEDEVDDVDEQEASVQLLAPSNGIQIGDTRPWPSWGFLLVWIVANTVGAVIGAFVASVVTGGLFATEPVYGSNIETFIREAANGLIVGACIGWVEWLVLNSYMFNSPGWVWATSGGWALGFLLVAVLQNYIGASLGSISAEGFATIIGVAVGLCQCVVIWDRVQRAYPCRRVLRPAACL